MPLNDEPSQQERNGASIRPDRVSVKPAHLAHEDPTGQAPRINTGRYGLVKK